MTNLEHTGNSQNNDCNKQYADSLQTGLVKADYQKKNKIINDNLKYSNLNNNHTDLQDKIAFNDPDIAKSVSYNNKNLKTKIKEIKSNLEEEQKVFSDDFSEENEVSNNNYLQAKQYLENIETNKYRRYKNKKSEFNIYSELVKAKLKILPKDKAEKARKFAYSLISKGLATGYAAGLTKHELAKQIIYHAATWKPTKLGYISLEKQIDAALAVAWRAVVKGTWQMPLDLAKAQILQY